LNIGKKKKLLHWRHLKRDDDSGNSFLWFSATIAKNILRNSKSKI